jgi:hypothetical protein
VGLAPAAPLLPAAASLVPLATSHPPSALSLRACAAAAACSTPEACAQLTRARGACQCACVRACVVRACIARAGADARGRMQALALAEKNGRLNGEAFSCAGRATWQLAALLAGRARASRLVSCWSGALALGGCGRGCGCHVDAAMALSALEAGWRPRLALLGHAGS